MTVVQNLARIALCTLALVVPLDCGGATEPPPEKCDPRAPFVHPNRSAAIVDQEGLLLDDPNPILFAGDELTAYFGASRNAAFALYRATRASRDSAFGRAVRLNGWGGGLAGVSTDGRRLYFVSVTTRLVRRATFVAPDTLVPDAEDQTLPADMGGGVYVSANEQVVVYTKDAAPPRAGKPIPTFYRRDRVGAGWTAELQINARGYLGTLSADGAFLVYLPRYFTGQGELNVAHVDPSDARFGKSVRVGENSGAQPSWLSPDGCRLYVIGSTGRIPGQPEHTINWLERAR